MNNAQVVCYLIAVVLLVLAGLKVGEKVSLGLLGAAVALLGYSLPALQHLVSG